MSAESLQSTATPRLGWKAVAWRLCAKYGFPLVLLVAACAFAMWFGSYSRRSGPANAGLTIDPAHLDFGSAWQGSRVAMTLPVKNPTSSRVDVRNVQLSCGCTLVKPHAFTIEPGETRQLNVEINLDAWPKEDRNLDRRRFQAAITPEFPETRDRQLGWVINGVVTKLVKVSLPTTALPDNLVIGHPFSPLTATATYAVPLENLTVECDPPKAVVTVHGGPEVFHLQIAPNADLPVGPIQFDVALQPHRKGEILPTTKLQLHGVIHDLVEPTPPNVTFGAVPVGSARSQTIILSSRNNTEFFVESWHANDDGTGVEAVNVDGLDAKTPRTFRIKQAIVELGRQESVVTFVVRLPGSRKADITCAVSYHGTTAITSKR